MTIQKFLEKLLEYYNKPIRGSFAYCKFYLQASTFSYELHDCRRTCFTEDSLIYESEVFWWGSSKQNKAIIDDIRKNTKEMLPKVW